MSLTKKEMVWLKNALYQYNFYTTSESNKMGKFIKKATPKQIKTLINYKYSSDKSEDYLYSHLDKSFIKEILEFRKQKRYKSWNRFDDNF